MIYDGSNIRINSIIKWMMMSPNIPFLDINYNNHDHGKKISDCQYKIFFIKGMDSTIQNSEKNHSRSQDMHSLSDIRYVCYFMIILIIIFVCPSVCPLIATKIFGDACVKSHSWINRSTYAVHYFIIRGGTEWQDMINTRSKKRWCNFDHWFFPLFTTIPTKNNINCLKYTPEVQNEVNCKFSFFLLYLDVLFGA